MKRQCGKCFGMGRGCGECKGTGIRFSSRNRKSGYSHRKVIRLKPSQQIVERRKED